MRHVAALQNFHHYIKKKIEFFIKFIKHIYKSSDTDWQRPDSKSVNHHTTSACPYIKRVNAMELSSLVWQSNSQNWGRTQTSSITYHHLCIWPTCAVKTKILSVTQVHGTLLGGGWVLLPMLLFIGICCHWSHNSLHESPNVKRKHLYHPQ